MKLPVRLKIALTLTALLLLSATVTAEMQPWQARSELQTRLAEAAHIEAALIKEACTHTATHTPSVNPMLPAARFYQLVGYSPVWVDRHGLRPQGRTLLTALAASADDGLDPDEYLLPSLSASLQHAMAFSDASLLDDPIGYIRLDVALTDAVLRYIQHLSQGRLAPESVSRQWFAPPKASTEAIPAELARALNQNRLEAYFESLHPKGDAYRGLKKALQHYEQIKRSGGWPAIAPGPTLQEGDTGLRVEALKRRLRMTHDLSAQMSVDPSGYDEIVTSAVKRFQQRHGLKADGLVGNQTRAAMNVSVEARIIQMQLNMERWRWYPDSFGDRYVMVNIPAFELRVIEAGRHIDSMRAIVGRKQRQTPVMSGRMTYLELNPYWNIPPKIARQDILPKVVGDPAYLHRQGIRIFDGWDHQARELDPAGITWENLSAGYFPYRLRQDPSQVNALGRVKFMFPNAQSVYIHDTPGRSLFNRQERTLSSGCVRVESPLVLAQYLLNNQGWDRSRLETAIAKGQRQAVVLDNPIPVHLVYFTTWVDDDGTVQFRQDIYGKDQLHQAAISQRAADLIFCSHAAEKGQLLAAGAPADKAVQSTSGGHIPVHPEAIETVLNLAENPIAGL